MFLNTCLFVLDYDAINTLSELCTRLEIESIILYFDLDVSFIFDSYALAKAIGDVLWQLSKDQFKHSISYLSYTLDRHKFNYSITTKELLAAIKGIVSL